MSMIGSLIDELNKSADEWNGSNMFELARMCREAADIIWQLRDDLQRTNAENAKLRESVKRLMAQRDERLARAEAENAELLDELENARMRGDDLASSISEWRAVTEARGQTIDRLAAYSAKLRELVRDMMRYYFMPSAIDSKQRETELLERAHELGVEKDNGELGVEVDG